MHLDFFRGSVQAGVNRAFLGTRSRNKAGKTDDRHKAFSKEATTNSWHARRSSLLWHPTQVCGQQSQAARGHGYQHRCRPSRSSRVSQRTMGTCLCSRLPPSQVMCLSSLLTVYTAVMSFKPREHRTCVPGSREAIATAQEAGCRLSKDHNPGGKTSCGKAHQRFREAICPKCPGCERCRAVRVSALCRWANAPLWWSYKPRRQQTRRQRTLQSHGAARRGGQARFRRLEPRREARGRIKSELPRLRCLTADQIPQKNTPWLLAAHTHREETLSVSQREMSLAYSACGEFGV